MPDSRFEVRFTLEERTTGWVRLPDGRVVEASSDGVDRVEFYISTNVGEDLRPLARVASGGEISRIMLALKSILAKSERLPILVFDEIDTGISGRMARKVGESMKDLARFHQIIAITHLPQIAALGDVHFTVSKSVENGRTVSRMLRIDDSSKTDHIAALLAGGDITDASRQSARELMGGDTAP
jgi:DNA repair protein RecN (Recombination protein N)